MDLEERQQRFAAHAWEPYSATIGRPETSGVRKLVTLAIVAALIAVMVLGCLRSLIDGVPKAVAETASSPTHFTFMSLEPGSTAPVRWSPCRPIHYVINSAGAPGNGVKIVQDAVSDAQAVSGLHFVFDGFSGRTPYWHAGTSTADLAEYAPVIIAWDRSSGDPTLKGDIVGLGGAVSWTINGVAYYTTGGVTLDADAFNNLSQKPKGPQQERSIVLHELGHLIGLDHVTDASQIMYPTTEGQLDYGSGDRNGLAILGRGPCD